VSNALEKEVQIKLNKGNTNAIIITTSNGVSKRKTVATEDLVASMAGTMKMSTGLLPFGTKFYTGSKTEYRIGIEIPGIIRHASFSLPNIGKYEKKIPFPSTLFLFHIQKERIQQSKLYACQPPLISDYNQLHWFPMGNVFDSGKICWGSVKIIDMKITSPIVLDSVVNRFFSSVFSGHLVHGTGAFIPPNRDVVNLDTLVKYLEKQTSFHTSMLKPAGITLRKAFDF